MKGFSMQELAFQVELPIGFAEAIDLVTQALKEKGFGVLTHIDVKATLKEKIDEEFRPYAILGACNPKLAHRALSSDSRAGLLLPCNVTVEESENGAVVSIINPQAMLASVDLASNPDVRGVADEARALLESVARGLQT
jgi:uncharacterized protein (DUF302 family)